MGSLSLVAFMSRMAKSFCTATFFIRYVVSSDTTLQAINDGFFLLKFMQLARSKI